MGNISNIPAALALFIQDEKEKVLRQSLKPKLTFRNVAAKEPISVGHGESVTKFRAGLLAPDANAKSVTSINGDLDNGLTAGQRTAEQFTITPSTYAQTLNLRKTDNVAKLIRDYAENADKLAGAADLTLDILAHRALYAAYMSGQTFATTGGSSSTSVTVDDVNGFETVMINGVPTPVSGSNPMSITINGVANTVTGVSVDGSNTSRRAAQGGRSGVLTVGTSVAVTAGWIVLAPDASFQSRPFASGVQRASDLAIVAGDLFTMRQVRRGIVNMRNNGVPSIGGKYNVYCSADSIDQLFLDTEFQNLVRGQGLSGREAGSADIIETMECRFIRNNVVSAQAAVGSGVTSAKIHRPILVGADALIEGAFEDIMGLSMEAGGESSMALHDAKVVNGISFVDRAPMDRLALSMAQSYFWLGGFTCPTDSLLTPTVFPTATSNRYKRAIILPHSE